MPARASVDRPQGNQGDIDQEGYNDHEGFQGEREDGELSEGGRKSEVPEDEPPIEALLPAIERLNLPCPSPAHIPLSLYMLVALEAARLQLPSPSPAQQPDTTQTSNTTQTTYTTHATDGKESTEGSKKEESTETQALIDDTVLPSLFLALLTALRQAHLSYLSSIDAAAATHALSTYYGPSPSSSHVPPAPPSGKILSEVEEVLPALHARDDPHGQNPEYIFLRSDLHASFKGMLGDGQAIPPPTEEEMCDTVLSLRAYLAHVRCQLQLQSSNSQSAVHANQADPVQANSDQADPNQAMEREEGEVEADPMSVDGVQPVPSDGERIRSEENLGQVDRQTSLQPSVASVARQSDRPDEEKRAEGEAEKVDGPQKDEAKDSEKNSGKRRHEQESDKADVPRSPYLKKVRRETEKQQEPSDLPSDQAPPARPLQSSKSLPDDRPIPTSPRQTTPMSRTRSDMSGLRNTHMAEALRCSLPLQSLSSTTSTNQVERELWSHSHAPDQSSMAYDTDDLCLLGIHVRRQLLRHAHTAAIEHHRQILSVIASMLDGFPSTSRSPPLHNLHLARYVLLWYVEQEAMTPIPHADSNEPDRQSDPISTRDGPSDTPSTSQSRRYVDTSVDSERGENGVVASSQQLQSDTVRILSHAQQTLPDSQDAQANLIQKHSEEDGTEDHARDPNHGWKKNSIVQSVLSIGTSLGL